MPIDSSSEIAMVAAKRQAEIPANQACMQARNWTASCVLLLTELLYRMPRCAACADQCCRRGQLPRRRATSVSAANAMASNASIEGSGTCKRKPVDVTGSTFRFESTASTSDSDSDVSW